VSKVTHFIPRRSKKRNITNSLNRIDFNRADYGYLCEQVRTLLDGFSIIGAVLTAEDDIHFYRGQKIDNKPTCLKRLSIAPKSKIDSYERCNQPYNPMFYCCAHPNTVLPEIRAESGQDIYVSRWSIKNPFIINTAIQSLTGDGSESSETTPEYEHVAAYIEAKFTSKIHETLSNEYMITAAISQILTGSITLTETSTIPMSNGKPIPLTPEILKYGMGGLSYPSVERKGAVNYALTPKVASECLQLDYVEHWKVLNMNYDGAYANSAEILREDVASDFSDDVIHWMGSVDDWQIPQGSRVKVAIEQYGGWVIKDKDGKLAAY
jgi:hypothetical protein